MDADRAPQLKASVGRLGELLAYANYIAAVAWDDVLRLRNGKLPAVRPLSVVVVSQLTAYWEKLQPLGACLVQILDGGQELFPSYWHPFRVPKVHSPHEVGTLRTNLQRSLEALTATERAAVVSQHELSLLSAVIEDAANAGAAIVSALEPPADEERAIRVACPFDEPDKLPIAWGNLSVMFKEFK